jgi:cellulose synthase/poly-beta-1,6-N-acetylglucosamine synthase-like glycosyltransferase
LNLFQWAEYVITQNMDKRAFNVVNAIGVVPGPVGAWRRSTVLAVGGYSLDTMVEDQDLTLALLATGHRVVYEPHAFAYSETPFTVKDFIKQRSRWTFGTLQCLWKYKRHLGSIRRPGLGWVVLPNFSFLLSLLIPLMDLLLVMTLLTGFARSTLVLYGVFLSIDLAYSTAAFWHERAHRWLVLLLPVQRLFYRFVIALVVWRSLLKAVEGAEFRWNSVRKRGDASALRRHMLTAPAALPLNVRGGDGSAPGTVRD